MGGRGASSGTSKFGVSITDKKGFTGKFYAVPGKKDTIRNENFELYKVKGGIPAVIKMNKEMGYTVKTISKKQYEREEAKRQAELEKSWRTPDSPIPKGAGGMARAWRQEARAAKNGRPAGSQ